MEEQTGIPAETRKTIMFARAIIIKRITWNARFAFFLIFLFRRVVVSHHEKHIQAP